MTDHDVLMDALRSGHGLSPEQAVAARLIDDRRSAQALPVLERLATHPGADLPADAPDPCDALDTGSEVTIGVAAASLIGVLARADARSIAEVYDTLWTEVARSPRLEGRAADRLLLQVLLTRCFDARYAALPPASAAA